MTFSVKDNQLFFDDNLIYQAPVDLKILEVFNDKALIFYKGYYAPQNASLEDVNRNVLMVRQDGKIIWRIFSQAERDNPITQIYKEGEGWIAIRFSDYGGDLNLEDGTLDNVRSFKFS
ncbi:MAG: hypothetical protein QF692_03535 [Alphaproteobacteria bacterium]|jgi:hypothetical protein|nr:hypothetical protein [Alphaproteobacteria bacterium]MDP7222317.1 hypothetical protein [Alphaproteobacteria bacterium]